MAPPTYRSNYLGSASVGRLSALRTRCREAARDRKLAPKSIVFIIIFCTRRGKMRQTSQHGVRKKTLVIINSCWHILPAAASHRVKAATSSSLFLPSFVAVAASWLIITRSSAASRACVMDRSQNSYSRHSNCIILERYKTRHELNVMSSTPKKPSHLP